MWGGFGLDFQSVLTNLETFQCQILYLKYLSQDMSTGPLVMAPVQKSIKHMLYLGYFPSEETIETKLGASHLWCYFLKSSGDSFSSSHQP